MPTLTRRRVPDSQQETWAIFYGGVRAGMITERVGNPTGTPRWQWACGFYPGSHPRECMHGLAATFEEARAAFEAAWQVFVASRTEADFEEYRRYEAFRAWKHAMWDAALPLPTQTRDNRARCFCGAMLWNAEVPAHVDAVHRIAS